MGKARELAEQRKLYCIAADDPLRSVDELTEICRTYLDKKIQIVKLEINKDESPVLGAAILLEGNHYDICHVQDLNYCWQRFVICKELFHVILDEEKYRNMGISDHVDEVTVAFPDDNSTPSVPVMSEILAELAAMEYLFPYAERVQEVASKNGNLNSKAVAEKFKVPIVFIERYLSTSYMDALKDF